MEQGWYLDPLDQSRQRHWTGTEWSAYINLGNGEMVSDTLHAPPVVPSLEDEELPEDPPPTELNEQPIAATEDYRVPVAALSTNATTPTTTVPGHATSTAYADTPASTAAFNEAIPAGGSPVPVPGWQLPVVIACLSLGAILLPHYQVGGEWAYSFRDFNDEFAWEAAWPFFAGIALLLGGSVTGKAGRIGLISIAAGAALWVGSAMIFVYVLELEIINAFSFSYTIGPGLICGFAAGGLSFVFAFKVLQASMRTEPQTVPIGFSLIVSAAAGYLAYLFIDTLDFSSDDTFWSDSIWLNIAIVAFLAPNLLNIVLPLVRSNSAALGIVGGYASIYAVGFVVYVLTDQGSTHFVGDGDLGGLTVILLGGGGCLLALVYDRMMVRSPARTTDIGQRSAGLAVVVAVTIGIVAVIYAANLDDDNCNYDEWYGEYICY